MEQLQQQFAKAEIAPESKEAQDRAIHMALMWAIKNRIRNLVPRAGWASPAFMDTPNSTSARSSAIAAWVVREGLSRGQFSYRLYDWIRYDVPDKDQIINTLENFVFQRYLELRDFVIKPAFVSQRQASARSRHAAALVVIKREENARYIIEAENDERAARQRENDELHRIFEAHRADEAHRVYKSSVHEPHLDAADARVQQPDADDMPERKARRLNEPMVHTPDDPDDLANELDAFARGEIEMDDGPDIF
jgi:hypothetical protein